MSGQSPHPLLHPADSTPSSSLSPKMAETLPAPNALPLFDFTHRRLPQPIQLPPLTIPPPSSKLEYSTAPAQKLTSRLEPASAPAQAPVLPAINSARATTPLRQSSRGYPGPAAPLDKLLSPQSYAPSRSENVYSSPPRSAVDTHSHSRRSSQKYVLDDQARLVQPEQPYVSPIEPYRQSSTSFPSPTSHGSGYAPVRPIYGQPAAPTGLHGSASFAPLPTEALPRTASGSFPYGPAPEAP